MSRRKLRQTAEETLAPPDLLSPSQTIARVVQLHGKDLYTVQTPAASSTLLVELENRFRNAVFVQRGGYVLVDTTASDRPNKIQGVIVNIVRNEKAWRKQAYWPREFAKKVASDGSDEEESLVGKMPPSDSEEEED
ncbi:hypothetical protein A1O3_05516 [Capronia epimyces CBS 606.96]|uniref:S1-like domain-containing protein n=1 Tax=Capronia epimyces CBS 606.96 TaxID=1182542 RepID=W9XWD6_9EURO|nr:uncharacterized protein A1O3_05516 [Capronia epimyces CBS 606.96]EXJ84842.1 hypothetical protein A1O3_05516 [Capronia epimyces CBS 606.96]